MELCELGAAFLIHGKLKALPDGCQHHVVLTLLSRNGSGAHNLCPEVYTGMLGWAPRLWPPDSGHTVKAQVCRDLQCPGGGQSPRHTSTPQKSHGAM